MIITEPGLRWRLEDSDRVAGKWGLSEMRRYRCVEHPQLVRVVQRPNGDAPWAELYYVDGLANQWHTPGEALAALQANLP